MEDGFYFLCPKCERLVKHLSVVFKEYNRYLAMATEKGKYSDEPGVILFINKNLDCELIKTEHKECGFISGVYEPEAFIVEVRKGKIFPIGDYWLENKEKLKELIKK